MIDISCETAECEFEQGQYSNENEFSCFANLMQSVILERNISKPVTFAAIGAIFLLGILIYGFVTNKHQPLKEIVKK